MFQIILQAVKVLQRCAAHRCKGRALGEELFQWFLCQQVGLPRPEEGRGRNAARLLLVLFSLGLLMPHVGAFSPGSRGFSCPALIACIFSCLVLICVHFSLASCSLTTVTCHIFEGLRARIDEVKSLSGEVCKEATLTCIK